MSDPDNLFLEVAKNLKRPVKKERAFETATVKAIGLGDVHNAASARMATMSFLLAALSEDDIVISCHDCFLVIYDQRAGRDLQTETETLQQALNTFYMGHQIYPSLRAKVTQHTMSSRKVVALLAGDAEENPESPIRFAPVNRSENARVRTRGENGSRAKSA